MSANDQSKLQSRLLGGMWLDEAPPQPDHLRVDSLNYSRIIIRLWLNSRPTVAVGRRLLGERLREPAPGRIQLLTRAATGRQDYAIAGAGATVRRASHLHGWR